MTREPPSRPRPPTTATKEIQEREALCARDGHVAGRAGQGSEGSAKCQRCEADITIDLVGVIQDCAERDHDGRRDLAWAEYTRLLGSAGDARVREATLAIGIAAALLYYRGAWIAESRRIARAQSDVEAVIAAAARRAE